MQKIKPFVLGVIVSVLLSSCASHAVDMDQLEKDLKTTGVQGWIHAAVHDRNLYVFTYRDPKNFFDYVEMSLIAYKPDLQTKLAGFDRHDKVLIKGVFLRNPSPQKHIMASQIDLVEKYQSKYPAPAYKYEAKIPEELLNKTKAPFLVHAVAGDGHILVVEYKDQVLPIFVKNGDLTKGLFRNDVVQLTYSVQTRPDDPTHLVLDESSPDAVKIVDPIKSMHGQPANGIKGALIMFPKSPEIKFNVFAVQQELQGGLKRQFTLVNFDDPVAFQKIREVLQAAWDRHPGQYTNGRNKLISTKIQVTATGTFNEVDASQANPQILLKDAGSVKVDD